MSYNQLQINILCIFTDIPLPTPASTSIPVSTDLTQATFKIQPIILASGDITDLAVVSPDMLVVSLLRYQCVQLLDSLKGEVVSEVELHTYPWGMCLTDENTAAVHISGKIQLIQVKDKTLIKGKELTVSGEICEITSCRNYLVVAYRSQPWLEVISIDGKVLKQFDNAKSQLFTESCSMCTTPSGSVFLSDWERNTITKLDAQLNLLQTFTSPLLQRSLGIIAVTEDQILVCSADNHSIVLLQPSTNTMSTLLGGVDGISCPFKLTYCPEKKKFYIATTHYSYIKVYQMS